MEKFTVNVHVTKAGALARGSASFGNDTMELSDEDIQKLSLGARTWLLGLNSAHRIGLADPAKLLEAIELQAVADSEKRAQEIQKREAEVLGAIAELRISTRTHDAEPFIVSGTHDYKIKEDPRYLARVGELQPELNRLCSEWTLERERLAAEREAKAAQEQLAREQRDEQIRLAAQAYMTRVNGQFSRAAKDGRNVIVQAKKKALKDIESIPNRTVDTYGRGGNVEVPDDTAYAFLDSARELAPQLRELAFEIVTSIEVCLVRGDLCPLEEQRDMHVVVRYTINWIDGDFDYVETFAEEGEPPHYDSEE